jgi:hypothetical protein
VSDSFRSVQLRVLFSIDEQEKIRYSWDRAGLLFFWPKAGRVRGLVLRGDWHERTAAESDIARLEAWGS